MKMIKGDLTISSVSLIKRVVAITDLSQGEYSVANYNTLGVYGNHCLGMSTPSFLCTKKESDNWDAQELKGSVNSLRL